MKSTVSITGDIVLDCHLYCGVKRPGPPSERGTTYRERLGGAALIRDMIAAAASAGGTALETHLALATATTPGSLQGPPRSYGVWTDHPRRKGAPDRVWRIDHPFGYGPIDMTDLNAIFKPIAATDTPALTVIDDGGIAFRHHAVRPAWPHFSEMNDGLVFFKTCSPICRGDLWPALAPVSERLIVLVSVGDLRREDVRISSGLSWEQTVEDTIAALQGDATTKELLRARHLVINFGSAGALWIERNGDQPTTRLVFDPVRMEDDFELDFQGTVYGFQASMAASLAYHIMKGGVAALGDGIVAGLLARRLLLELGHGAIDKPNPDIPVAAIGHLIADTPGEFVTIVVPPRIWTQVPAGTIVAQSEFGDASTSPLVGLGLVTARYGKGALSHVPALRLGKFFTVDRSEIESLRTLALLVRAYDSQKIQKRPLCIGVFGPPGAGKSFAVRALAEAILGDKVPFLEFNLSQMEGAHELIGPFHRIRDAALKGVTPIAFWDEFDSQQYKWLQYLLAPMQDGAFQEGQITHPIGKCIFIFAGGTSPTLQQFGVIEGADGFTEFKLLKGPDFISRLDGFLNVLGPNPSGDAADITWPVRRALTLRGMLGIDDAELDIDPGLLYALIAVPKYTHGVRSFEKIVSALARGRDNGRLHRSALPAAHILERDTNVQDFDRLMNRRSAFNTQPNIEALAAAIHRNFLATTPTDAIRPDVNREYEELPEDRKASNRAAAGRIPDHLALINFVVLPRTAGDDDTWKRTLAGVIEQHLERLARAEHAGWVAERAANGWIYGESRDDTLKRHPLMVPWSRLKPIDQDKDRSSVRAVPQLLQDAGYKAVTDSDGLSLSA